MPVAGAVAGGSRKVLLTGLTPGGWMSVRASEVSSRLTSPVFCLSSALKMTRFGGMSILRRAFLWRGPGTVASLSPVTVLTRVWLKSGLCEGLRSSGEMSSGSEKGDGLVGAVGCVVGVTIARECVPPGLSMFSQKALSNSSVPALSFGAVDSTSPVARPLAMTGGMEGGKPPSSSSSSDQSEYDARV